MFRTPAALLLLPLVAGSLVYCALVIVAARRYRSVLAPELSSPQPISILKPLLGVDEGLEENLRSFFVQRYPGEFEMLFAVRDASDPAIPIVRSLQAEFPYINTQLLLTGEPPYPNAKVFSLDCMMRAAAHEILVLSDSDIRVTSDMLAKVAAEFQDPRIGVATCPYRAVPGASIWSRLEAAGMNTEFLAGILVARMLEGMKFAVGPTIVARREAIEAVGGFGRLKDYLAEDFMLGKLAAEQGIGVVLSGCVVEHRIGSQGWRANFRHRLRWARSTRRSRPAGYFGQLFTNPLPMALLLCAVDAGFWPLLVLTILLRAWVAVTVSRGILGDRLVARQWWLIPAQDLLSLAFWIAGLFGNTITWRGRRYHLFRDGSFALKGHD